jgi:hypothetical protein
MCVGAIVRQNYAVEARSYVCCCDRIRLAKTEGVDWLGALHPNFLKLKF